MLSIIETAKRPHYSHQRLMSVVLADNLLGNLWAHIKSNTVDLLRTAAVLKNISSSVVPFIHNPFAHPSFLHAPHAGQRSLFVMTPQ